MKHQVETLKLPGFLISSLKKKRRRDCYEANYESLIFVCLSKQNKEFYEKSQRRDSWITLKTDKYISQVEPSHKGMRLMIFISIFYVVGLTRLWTFFFFNKPERVN